MTGPESPHFEKWDAAAKRPAGADPAGPDAAPPAGAPPAGPPPARLRPSPPSLPGRFAVAALAFGLLAAIALPGNRLGAGVLAAAVALAFAARAARTDAPEPTSRWWRWGWGVVALLLAGSAALRDATWVVLPALAGSLGCGSLAVAGGRTWAGVARGVAAAALHSTAGPRLVVYAAATSAPRSGPAIEPIARGAALAALLVTVFGVLFVSGDAAFAQFAEDSVPEVGDADILALRGLLFAAAVALAGGFALARLRGSRDDESAPKRTLGTTEWVVALVALDLLVAAFVGVQLAVLFGDSRHVLDTAGLTYSEYAREGFGQLLVAAALTLAVVGAALRYSPPGQRTAIRIALGVLCVLTVVVLASALHRLGLYEDAYGATRLRFAANAGILFVGAILALVLAALTAARFAWLPRASAMTAAAALIAFVAVNPDLRIAERNLDRGLVDRAYLSDLSADAQPALPPDLRRRPGPDGLFGWNLARVRAR